MFAEVARITNLDWLKCVSLVQSSAFQLRYRSSYPKHLTQNLMISVVVTYETLAQKVVVKENVHPFVVVSCESLST